MSFTVMTDTSANLPPQLLRERGIETVAFPCFVEDEPLDTAAFDGHSFYQAMRRGAGVTTAAINPAEYAQAFSAVLERGGDLLFVGMSSGLSGSFRNAELAARELRERWPERTLRLIDTLGASLGEGLVALRAAELRDAGRGIDETAEELRGMAQRMCQVFTVGDLRYLRRGGRLSNAAAILGTVLQIKPILLGNEEGKIVGAAKVRGREKAIAYLAEQYNALAASPSLQTVGIAHADDPQAAEQLAALLRKKRPPREILTVLYEPVTGCHVGPDTLALFFQASPGVRPPKG